MMTKRSIKIYFLIIDGLFIRGKRSIKRFRKERLRNGLIK